MSRAEQLASFLGVLIEGSRPTLAGKIQTRVSQHERFFLVTPRGAGCVVTFGRQARADHVELMRVIEDAANAAEQIILGLTTAAAIGLDADTRWEYDQRQLPCSD